MSSEWKDHWNNNHSTENHTHVYKYFSTVDEHWKECIVGNCDSTTAAQPHVYDNNQDSVCNECGFRREIKEEDTTPNNFVDVNADSYYHDAVFWASKMNITTGTDTTHFSPRMTCTRAQAVTFLWRAAGSPKPKTGIMPFGDIAAGSYYYDAVLWAFENNITTGTDASHFSPRMTCTRAQIVTFLWRALRSPIVNTVNPFIDVSADTYYVNAVLWAVKENVTTGTSDSTFSPSDDCTRAQIVTFLYRALTAK